METHALHAPAPQVDPAEWLVQFEAVGGGFVVRGEEASVTLALFRRSPEDQRAGRAMIGQIEADPVLRGAIIAHLNGNDTTDTPSPPAAKPEEDDGASWQSRVDRWRALAALADADAKFGTWNRIQTQLAEQRLAILQRAPADKTESLRQIEARHADGFTVFLENFDRPVIEAAVDVIRTPAPDVAGIEVKLAIIERHELDLDLTIEIDLMQYIRADVARLFGEA